MAKITNAEYKEIMREKRELFDLILKKTGTKKTEIFDLAMQEYIVANLDLVTETEKRRFKNLVF